jgi:hypothetical protein
LVFERIDDGNQIKNHILLSFFPLYYAFFCSSNKLKQGSRTDGKPKQKMKRDDNKYKHDTVSGYSEQYFDGEINFENEGINTRAG